MVRKLLSVKPSVDPFQMLRNQADTLIYSDLHLHERPEFSRVDPTTGLNARLVEGLYILQQIIDILNAHPEIKYLYFLGDIFELKDKVPNHILLEFQKKLEELIKMDVRLLSLMGNHDFNIIKYPVIKLFDMGVITSPQIIKNYEGAKIALLPYERDFETFIKKWGELNKQKPDIFFFHGEIPGVTYETGKKIGGIFPQNFLLPETLYISGHVHKHQKVNRVLFVGSPYQTRFSDEGQIRYIWLLDTKNKGYAPIKLHYPEFRTIDVQIDQISKENVAGNYIRVAGEVPASQWDIQTRREMKEKLEKLGAKGISFQVQTIKQRQVQIPNDKIEDDPYIIESFVKNNIEKTQLNKEELLRVGMELFKPT